MQNADYQSLCRTVEKGENKFVENVNNHHAGKVVACNWDMVEVDIFGRRESWPFRDCVEIKPNFDFHE